MLLSENSNKGRLILTQNSKYKYKDSQHNDKTVMNALS